jgi:hypothetical protein
VAGAQPSLPPDTRNDDFSGRRFRLYVTAVALLGTPVLAFSVWSLTPPSLLALEPAFWVLCALLVVAEVRPLFTAGAKDANGLALSTSFVFALLLRYGLPVAILVQALATLVADISRRNAPGARPSTSASPRCRGQRRRCRTAAPSRRSTARTSTP